MTIAFKIFNYTSLLILIFWFFVARCSRDMVAAKVELADLPSEIVELFFALLDPASRKAFALTSKSNFRSFDESWVNGRDLVEACLRLRSLKMTRWALLELRCSLDVSLFESASKVLRVSDFPPSNNGECGSKGGLLQDEGATLEDFAELFLEAYLKRPHYQTTLTGKIGSLREKSDVKPYLPLELARLFSKCGHSNLLKNAFASMEWSRTTPVKCIRLCMEHPNAMAVLDVLHACLLKIPDHWRSEAEKNKDREFVKGITEWDRRDVLMAYYGSGPDLLRKNTSGYPLAVLFVSPHHHLMFASRPANEALIPQFILSMEMLPPQGSGVLSYFLIDRFVDVRNACYTHWYTGVLLENLASTRNIDAFKLAFDKVSRLAAKRSCDYDPMVADHLQDLFARSLFVNKRNIGNDLEVFYVSDFLFELAFGKQLEERRLPKATLLEILLNNPSPGVIEYLRRKELFPIDFFTQCFLHHNELTDILSAIARALEFETLEMFIAQGTTTWDTALEIILPTILNVFFDHLQEEIDWQRGIRFLEIVLAKAPQGLLRSVVSKTRFLPALLNRSVSSGRLEPLHFIIATNTLPWEMKVGLFHEGAPFLFEETVFEATFLSPFLDSGFLKAWPLNPHKLLRILEFFVKELRINVSHNIWERCISICEHEGRLRFLSKLATVMGLSDSQ